MGPGRNDQLPAITHKLLHRRSQTIRQRAWIVEDYQSIIRNAGRVDGAGGFDRETERQRVIQIKRALQIETVTAAARRAFDNQGFGGSLTTNGEIEFVVRSEVIGRDFDDATVAAFADIESGEFDNFGFTRVETDLAFLNCLIVDLKINCQSIARRIAEVT